MSKFPKKMVIHTERILPDETYLNEWMEEMSKTAIPMEVLGDILKTGKGTWKTNDGANIVQTAYEITTK